MVIKIVKSYYHPGDDISYPHLVYGCNWCGYKKDVPLVLLSEKYDKYGTEDNFCLCLNCLERMVKSLKGTTSDML